MNINATNHRPLLRADSLLRLNRVETTAFPSIRSPGGELCFKHLQPSWLLETQRINTTKQWADVQLLLLEKLRLFSKEAQTQHALSPTRMR